MILSDGTDFKIPTDTMAVLRRAYPNVDLDQEIAKMDAWCLCNAARRKSRRGIMRFVNNWLRSVPRGTSTRQRSLEQDLTDRSWASR